MQTESKSEKIGRYIFHAISMILVVFSLYLTFYRFSAVSRRVFQSLEDLGRSFAYYFMSCFKKQDSVQATVQLIPKEMNTLLPLTGEEFKNGMRVFWALFKNRDNFAAYTSEIGGLLYKIGILLIVLSIPTIFAVLIAWLMYYTVDTKTGKKSQALEAWLWLESVTYYPIKNAIVSYVRFLINEGRWYLITFCVIWAWNLNLFTIVFEFLAFILWIPFSREWGNVFVQVAKLAVDLSVIFDVLPTWLLIVIGALLFHLYRRHIGFERLKSDEEDNKAFLLKYPGNLLATGPPRAGKTQAITDMTISQEIIFREVAQKKSFERAMEFPFFEWGILEQSIIKMREKIATFDLSFIREWIPRMESHFTGRAIYAPFVQTTAMKQLKAWGYQGDDFIFNYDYKRYRLEYDNHLTIVKLFKCVELYAEEFQIYTSPTPLIFGNYPIRTQIQWKTFGNYPLMYAELFKISPRKAFLISKYNHIVNHDALRLGRKKDPNGIYNDSYDMGCLTLSELGKELGNQLTNRGKGKEKDGENCNANNDLWTTNAKMISHGTTIDFETYSRILADEQRAMSILADFRELGSEMKIERRERKDRIKMPFFAFEEMLYVLAEKLMNKVFLFFKSRHGLTTLLYYLLLRIYAPIYTHYHRIFNVFASHDIELDMKDWAGTGEDGKKKKVKEIYHISRKKVCSDVYNTGFFATYYRKKWKRSSAGGLNQTPQFKGLDPTIDEMLYQKSHFNEEVFKYFGIAV